MSWSQLLDHLGASRNALGEVSHFPGSGQPVLIIGDHLAVIAVRGPETEKFLQGQLTCDVNAVIGGHWRLAMHLDLKGRGQHSYVALPAADGVDLLTCRASADDALAALKKYAMFSKVTLTRDDDRRALMLREPPADEAMSSITLPTQIGEATQGPHSTLARLDVSTLLLVTGVQGARQLLNHYTVAELGGSDDWLRHEIGAGIGHIRQGGGGLWLPQALNYDVLDGVNFRKGCYLGQEVVARMHFKGRMKLRMQRLHWQGAHVAPAGSLLRDTEGHAAGELVVAVSNGETTDALVVLRLDHQGPLMLNGVALDWQAGTLPYSLPT
ncbi:MAG: YgfZ/GcvT domain-containing protein [Alcanivoracaceae bacterium]